MNPDYYAVLGEKDYPNGFTGIDYNDVDGVTTRYHVLVATGRKEDKEIGGNALRSKWAEKRLNVELEQLPSFLDLSPIDLSQLPSGSFFVQFAFKLLKPYISRDDNQFYILDNPIVRDKVFRLPMVRPSAWKGSLRHALWQLGREKEDEQIRRLFGTANDEKPDEGNSGRLYFYPTFFTQTSLEVINPHDRERRIGKNPILMESVPAAATGTFTLLYTPLDRIGKDETKTRQQIFTDLQLVAQGLEAMFTLYGFGAKTSSGFGLADNKVSDGMIVVGGLPYESEPSALAATPPAPASPDLPRYLAAPGQLKPEYLNEKGGFRYRHETEQKAMKKADRQLYDKAKKWWEQEGQQLAQQPTPEPETTPELEPPPPYPLAHENFATFNDLPVKATKLADALRQMGGGA